MDRRVDIKINGTHLSKDGNRAGVRGEANVTYLRITFDAGWNGYAKKVTFWDARGKHPVTIPLTADMLEDITSNIDTYHCPIPGEALTEGGLLTFIIDGYTDGKRQRSVSDNLEVIPAPMTEGSGEAQDPTPSEAERLQVQIDSILDVIERDLVGASEHAANAATSEMNAAEYARQARESANDALASENAAAGHAAAANAAAQAAMDAANSTMMPALELMPNQGDSIGGYIDFHYSGEYNDFTSRIIESGRGIIDVFAQLRESGQRVYSPNNKPNAVDVGAVQDGILGLVDLNQAPQGIFACRDCSNGPAGNTVGLLISKMYDGNYGWQLYHSYAHKKTFQRYCDGAVWAVWEEIYTSRNLTELRDALKAIW